MWWNSDGGTVWWNSVVEEWNSVAEQWNSDGGTVWWNTGTVIVEQWNSVVEQWNSDGGTVIVEQCGGRVEKCCGTVGQ